MNNNVCLMELWRVEGNNDVKELHIFKCHTNIHYIVVVIIVIVIIIVIVVVVLTITAIIVIVVTVVIIIMRGSLHTRPVFVK